MVTRTRPPPNLSSAGAMRRQIRRDAKGPSNRLSRAAGLSIETLASNPRPSPRPSSLSRTVCAEEIDSGVHAPGKPGTRSDEVGPPALDIQLAYLPAAGSFERSTRGTRSRIVRGPSGTRFPPSRQRLPVASATSPSPYVGSSRRYPGAAEIGGCASAHLASGESPELSGAARKTGAFPPSASETVERPKPARVLERRATRLGKLAANSRRSCVTACSGSLPGTRARTGLSYVA